MARFPTAALLLLGTLGVLGSPGPDTEGAMAGPGEGGGLTEERGFDRRGDDYTSFKVQSLGECKRACGREERCRAYSFSQRSGDCYLKGRVNSRERNADMVTGYKPDAEGGDRGDRGDRGDGRGPGWGSGGERNLSEEWGYDRSGNDYRAFDARGVGECKRACIEERRCLAYTFLTRSNTCYLKDRSGYPQRESGAVTGAKGGGGGFNPFRGGLTEETGYDRRGDDYDRLRTRSLESCQAACRRDTRCRAYSFFPSAGDCYLKNRINSRDYNPEAVTGYKEGH